MKIAIVSQPFDGVLPPQQNSIGMWIFEVARRLAQRHNVIVYARGGRFHMQTLMQDGVHYRHVPMGFDALFMRVTRRLSGYNSPGRPLFASKYYFPAYMAQVASDLRRQRCDVIHVINFSQFAPAIRRLNPGSKIVLNMRCDWLAQLDRRMIEQRLQTIDRILGCSDHITARIRARYPRYAALCQTLHNGVDTELFIPANPKRVQSEHTVRLLYVGRISPEKGVHVLLDAFHRALQRCPNLHLEIIGPPGQLPRDFFIDLTNDARVAKLEPYYTEGSRFQYWNELHDQSHRLGLDDHVKFHRNVPHMQLAPHFQAADIFVFPSIWDEPFGVPPIEAMATGLPVVATRSGGLPEIIDHGNTGLLVEPGNAAELGSAIMKLAENEKLREAMGRAGRQRAAEQFSFDSVVKNLLEHYHETLALHESSYSQHLD